MVVLGPGGEVELATSDASARAVAPFHDEVLERLESCERCELVVGRPAVTLYAFRMESPLRSSAGPRALVLLRERPPEPSTPGAPRARLTSRQRQVCEYAAAGATTGEIARHLSLSAHTVRSHIKSAYQRLGVASRVELAHAIAALPAAS